MRVIILSILVFAIFMLTARPSNAASPQPWYFIHAEGQEYPYRIKSVDGYIVFMGKNESNARFIYDAVMAYSPTSK